ncbi:hypothetical protein F5Y19DRAFT_428849 [Xylariaceae sp. FL1651]|nr:hypothetical protein F5Y19DRAFT_428849 [Xylariaceae sp. FL1651]
MFKVFCIVGFYIPQLLAHLYMKQSVDTDSFNFQTFRRSSGLISWVMNPDYNFALKVGGLGKINQYLKCGGIWGVKGYF